MRDEEPRAAWAWVRQMKKNLFMRKSTVYRKGRNGIRVFTAEVRRRGEEQKNLPQILGKPGRVNADQRRSKSKNFICADQRKSAA